MEGESGRLGRMVWNGLQAQPLLHLLPVGLGDRGRGAEIQQRSPDAVGWEKFAILPLSILAVCYYAIPCL
jgi:hypothetical protein